MFKDLDLDIELLKQYISYNPETGNFTWLKRRGAIKAGSTAGFLENTGYIRLRFNGRQYCAHRLAWAISYNKMPDGVIDHIDGNVANNKLSNLRDISFSENLQNQRKAHKNSASGKLGVTRRGNKWQARIDINKKQTLIGVFDTIEEAYKAYLEKKRTIHKACTI